MELQVYRTLTGMPKAKPKTRIFRSNIGINLFPPNGITDEEEAQHLEEAVAGDKFPHPFHSPLMQELKNFPITVGIGKPSAEIGLRDTVKAANAPLFLLQRGGKGIAENGFAEYW